MYRSTLTVSATLLACSLSAQISQIPASQCGPGVPPVSPPTSSVTSSAGAAAGDMLTITMTPGTTTGISALIIGVNAFNVTLPCGGAVGAPTGCTFYADIDEFFVVGPFPQTGAFGPAPFAIPPGLAGGILRVHGIEFLPGVAGACNSFGFDYALPEAWEITFQ